MNTEILNLDHFTYYVKFQFRCANGSYFFRKASDLKKILEDKADLKTTGIEFLKEFDVAKQKFVKVTPSKFISQNSFDTEGVEYLKNHPYFSKVKF